MVKARTGLNWIVWIALAFCCTAADAEGAFQSGDNLLGLCLGKEVGICLGYVEAVADAMSEKSPGKSPRICVLRDVTGQRVLDVVISFLPLDAPLVRFTDGFGGVSGSVPLPVVTRRLHRANARRLRQTLVNDDPRSAARHGRLTGVEQFDGATDSPGFAF